ncbi:response regulator [Zavarzinella formosa]|uniref:response regulator n=1 Tax=Zavarzinella formosa TaxID=360055 RepID=UPI0002EF6FA8|nr:response regulator [Zavarzinella formosa]
MATVLLVDDDVMVRAATRLMLERAGIDVAEAGDGAEGVRLFQKRQADVVLCDLFMPGKDGLELIRELCRDYPGVRIIAMSGGGHNGAVDMLPAARKLGAAKVLYKPFNQAEVLAAFREISDHKPDEFVCSRDSPQNK